MSRILVGRKRTALNWMITPETLRRTRPNPTRRGCALAQFQKTSVVPCLLLIALQSGCTSLPVAPQQQQAWQQDAARACLDRRGDAALVPTRDFRSDGCSLWPDGSWQMCCVAHDMDYWCGGAARDRRKTDRTLGQCVSDQGHPVIGRVMSAGVRVFGTYYLPLPWRWGFGWPWLGQPAPPAAQ